MLPCSILPLIYMEIRYVEPENNVTVTLFYPENSYTPNTVTNETTQESLMTVYCIKQCTSINQLDSSSDEWGEEVDSALLTLGWAVLPFGPLAHLSEAFRIFPMASSIFCTGSSLWMVW